MRGRGEDLSRPRKDRRGLGIHYDTDAFGRFSEAIARFLGTARYLVFQTVVIALWIVLNIFAPDSLRFVAGQTPVDAGVAAEAERAP